MLSNRFLVILATFQAILRSPKTHAIRLAHVGAQNCQYTIPNSAATTRLTAYSNSTTLGNATCTDLESLGFS
jgi:hypothetical protein